MVQRKENVLSFFGQFKVIVTNATIEDNDNSDIDIQDMYSIEFQKRGLQHVHLLIFLHPSNKYSSPDDIDRIISAEIPCENDGEVTYDSWFMWFLQ
ncbi:hypothetical protein Lal_00016881 [Lupinus albus]|nr:hypothetical protein Lal_00016881 [Lupinus albus]